MGTVHAQGPAFDATSQTRCSRDIEKEYRARVGEIVRAFWSAYRGSLLKAYLEPIPVTRLYAAQRAFREIGAVRAANILRSGLFRLTRVGSPAALSCVVAEMTALLDGTSDDVDGLTARFLAGQVCRTSSAATFGRRATALWTAAEPASQCEEDR